MPERAEPTGPLDLYKGLVAFRHAANLLNVTGRELADACRRAGVEPDSIMERRDLRRVALKMAAVEPNAERKARIKDGIKKLETTRPLR